MASYTCLSEGVVLLAAPMLLLAPAWIVLWILWGVDVWRRQEQRARGEEMILGLGRLAALPVIAFACVGSLAVWSEPGAVFLMSRGSLESVAERLLADGASERSGAGFLGMQEAGGVDVIGLLPVERTLRDRSRVFFELGGSELFERSGYLYARSYPRDLEGGCEIEQARRNWWRLTCDVS
jgi:hypothetical protein